MTSISFIGLGGMTRAIATRAVAGGNTVEIIGRDASRAGALAAELSYEEYSVTDLRMRAREVGLTGYSGLKKTEAVNDLRSR